MMNPLDWPNQFQEVIVGEPIYLPNADILSVIFPVELAPVIDPILKKNVLLTYETEGGTSTASLRVYSEGCREDLQDYLIEQQWPHSIEIIDKDMSSHTDWIRADFRWINNKYVSQVSDASSVYVQYSDVLAAFNNNTLDKLKADMELIRDSLHEYVFSDEDIAQAKVQVLKEIVNDNP